MHPSCYAHIICLHRLLHYRPYSPDKSINSFQDGAVHYLLKKASNPTTLGGLDVDSATKKANLLDVFSDKCVRSNEVSFLMNKAVSFIKNRTTSLLSRATVQNYLDLQQQQEEGIEDGIVRVGTPEVASGSGSDDLFPSGYQFGFKGYDQMPFDYDPPSVCVTVPSPSGISKEVRVGVSSDDLGLSELNISKAAVSSTIGLNESMKVQLHKSSLPWWYLGLTMMVTLILGVILVTWRSSTVSLHLPSWDNNAKLFFGMLSFVSSDAGTNSKSSRSPIRSFVSFKRSARRMISLLALAVSGILSSPAYAFEVDKDVSTRGIESCTSIFVYDILWLNIFSLSSV